eukprot:CFRG7711T1
MSINTNAHTELLALVKIHLPENEVLDELTMWALKSFVLCRKRINPSISLNDRNTLAKSIADCIPKGTFSDVQQRIVENKDSQAQLDMADIYMFGLKEQKRDIEMAAYLYQKAAQGAHPEAQTQMGIMMYQNISRTIAPNNPDAQTLTRPLPVKLCEESPKLKPYLDYLWIYLEDAASQGYVSTFTLTQARNASVSGSDGEYPLPTNLKLAFLDYGAYAMETLKTMANTNPLGCFNVNCDVTVGDVSDLKVCGRCRTAKYCSKGCQVASWKAEHKLACMVPGSTGAC